MDVTRIPKIELHLHLDGAVPPETMWRMAQEKHVSLPVDTLDEFYAWLVKTADCHDVNTYLARFELPLQLMQDAPGITRITCDVLTTLARQGHIYDELRFAPQLHTRAGLRQPDAPEAGLEESPAPETSSPVAETPPAETVAPYQTIRLGLLNGPTGMGAAKLLADSDAAFAQAEEGTYDTTEGTFFHYELTLGSDPPTDIVPKLNNGELDIAAVPTNLAATLYNKAGSIRLLALNTLGVLHILENGDTVHSMADLAGKTIYSINQGTNTEYVLNYLLEESGLTPGEDVTIEWKTSEEVTALMASGGIDLCMLPVPAATSVMMQNADVRDAIDLNDVWQKMGAAGTFTMGCVVARSDFVEEHPEAAARGAPRRIRPQTRFI